VSCVWLLRSGSEPSESSDELSQSRWRPRNDLLMAESGERKSVEAAAVPETGGGMEEAVVWLLAFGGGGSWFSTAGGAGGLRGIWVSELLPVGLS
jgi:hypothetical protein